MGDGHGRDDGALDNTGRPIARRDILQGVAALAGTSMLSPPVFAGVSETATAAQDQPGYYPPAFAGLRGDHPGSFETAHQLRDGPIKVPSIMPTTERYDLVIVGGGISGLSAAWFYREARPDARILILDNHDDFGGHAKRNEFALDGKIHLLNGGTFEIDSPRPYSVIAAGLLKRLGIEPGRLKQAYAKPEVYRSLGLRRASFSIEKPSAPIKLVVERDGTTWMQRLANPPLSPRVQADIARIYETTRTSCRALRRTRRKPASPVSAIATTWLTSSRLIRMLCPSSRQ